MKAFKVPSTPNAFKKSLLDSFHILATVSTVYKLDEGRCDLTIIAGREDPFTAPCHTLNRDFGHLASSALYHTPKYAEVVDKSSQYAFDIYVSIHFNALALASFFANYRHDVLGTQQ